MAEATNWAEIANLLALELRSPLAAIQGFIELTQYAGPLTERQEYFSERALASVRQMQLVITRMVAIGWIDGDHPLHYYACDLETLVVRSVDLLRDQAERREVTVQVEVDPNLGEVEADSLRLEQVIVELLSNAIRFNQRGGTVWVSLHGYDDDVELTVRDSGYGIATDDLPLVFDRFYRAVPQSRQVAPGMGVGLWLVKTLVEKHGGRVWVDSVVGVGTTFGVRLPRVPSVAAHLSEESTVSREVESALFDVPESIYADHTASSEQIDAVDDNLQEPPSIHDDHDDDGDAVAAEL